MLLRETLVTVLATPAVAGPPPEEVPRWGVESLRRPAGHALVLAGVRRCGKSTLQQQLRRKSCGRFFAAPRESSEIEKTADHAD